MLVGWSVDCSYCLRISNTFTASPKKIKQFFLLLLLLIIISSRRFACSSKTFMDWMDAVWFMRSSCKYILAYASSSSYSYDTRSTSRWIYAMKGNKQKHASFRLCVLSFGKEQHFSFWHPQPVSSVESLFGIWNSKMNVKNGIHSHSAQNHT